MRRLSSLASAVVLSLCVSVPAFAAPLERTRYSDSFTLEVEQCGATWTVTVTREGMFILKAGRAGDPTPYVQDNFVARIVWTDTNDPSRSYVVVLQAMFKDVRITHVEDTVYLVEAMEVGQPFTIRTSTGRVVMHDRGRLVASYLIDTQGDADPSNDTFVEDLGLELYGQFPSFADDFDRCAIVAEAVGD